MRTVTTALFLFLLLLPAFGQQTQNTEPGPIQDNSFLLEEAYNQEPGVIQHISSFTRLGSRNWSYTFTQEWPVPGQKHQLSYTLVGGNAGGGTGWGDTMINYRYQLLGTGETKVAIAPRASFIAPSGDPKRGLGAGGSGVQFDLPVSWVLTKKLVTHWNAGTTLTPRARDAAGDHAFTTAYNYGASAIFLAHPNFNVMLEAVTYGNADVIAPDRTQRSRDVFLNPGIRWAHNFKSGLQIVPGISVPVGVGPSAGQKGILLYLSFEHPLWKPR